MEDPVVGSVAWSEIEAKLGLVGALRMGGTPKRAAVRLSMPTETSPDRGDPVRARRSTTRFAEAGASGECAGALAR
jgi:hypothetical protein